MVQNYSFLSE